MPVIVLSENFISALYERLAVFDTAFMRPVTFYVKPSVEALMRHDRRFVNFTRHVRLRPKPTENKNLPYFTVSVPRCSRCPNETSSPLLQNLYSSIRSDFLIS